MLIFLKLADHPKRIFYYPDEDDDHPSTLPAPPKPLEGTAEPPDELEGDYVVEVADPKG